MERQRTNNHGSEPQEERNNERDLSQAFLDVQAIARYLGIKPSSIYSMVEEKKVPHYRIGRQIRFKKSEIDEWMAGQREAVVDVKMETKKVIRSLQRRPGAAVDWIVKKAIDEAGKKGYTSSHGKPDHDKGLRKEVEHGSL